MTVNDYIGLYGATLSTIIAMVTLIKYLKVRAINVNYRWDPYDDKLVLTFSTSRADTIFVNYFYFQSYKGRKVIDEVDCLHCETISVTFNKNKLGKFELYPPNDQLPKFNKFNGEKVKIKIFLEGRKKGEIVTMIPS